MRLRLLLASVVAIVAAEQQQPPIRTLVPELQIGGPDETRDAYNFAAVSGLAIDSTGRIVVNDFKNNVVRVFSGEGTFAYEFGRKGGGPGDLSTVLGGVFGPDGLFWIRDEQNLRATAFALGPDRAVFRHSVRLENVRPTMRFTPVGIDPQGRIVQPGTFHDPASGKLLPFRLLIDTSGRVVGGDTVPLPRGDSVGDGAIRKIHKADGRVSGYSEYMYYQPFGASLTVAYAANGDYARAITSRYDVEWRNASGRLLRTLRRPIEGAPLTAAERRTAQSDIDDFVAMAKISPSEIRHGIPARKGIIRQLAFDQLGRLWIQRRVPEGNAPEADLYDATGRWIAIVRWPKGINPIHTPFVGARGDRVLAVATDSNDVQWVTRLVMK